MPNDLDKQRFAGSLIYGTRYFVDGKSILLGGLSPQGTWGAEMTESCQFPGYLGP